MTFQNHYEVLGVSSDADLPEIRAAYVCLLKRYHPDWAGVDEAQESADQLQRVVAAYKILKDPATRAKYDAGLQRSPHRSSRFKPSARPTVDISLFKPAVARSGAEIPLFKPAVGRSGAEVPLFKPVIRPTAEPSVFKPIARPSAVVRLKRPFKLDRDSLSYLLMFVAGIVGLYLFVSAVVGSNRSPMASAALAGSPVRNVPAITEFEPVVRRAAIMSEVDAGDYSWRCFAAAGRSHDPVAADPCVGFDAAYVSWRQAIAGVLVTDPYFDPDAVRSRAESAFRRLGPIEASVRVESIRASTFQALMQVSATPNELSADRPEERQANARAARRQAPDRAAIFAATTNGSVLAEAR